MTTRISFAESCFVNTFYSVAAFYPDRREEMNNWLHRASEIDWLDVDRMSPGSTALAVLVTRPNSLLRKRLTARMQNREFMEKAGPHLLDLASTDWQVLSRLCYWDGDDRERNQVLFEAIRSRFKDLSRFLVMWLLVDHNADISRFLTDDADESTHPITNRAVAPTPDGLATKAILDVLNQIVLPEHSSDIAALVMRRILELIKVVPSGHLPDPAPWWYGRLPQPEQTFIERTLGLTLRERFVLLATVYVGMTADELSLTWRPWDTDGIWSEERIATLTITAWNSFFAQATPDQ